MPWAKVKTLRAVQQALRPTQAAASSNEADGTLATADPPRAGA
ncbi:hypothetical protein [Candidatus Accumulibacter phosphatis]|nr:hypothetical protein [Candidatus Accumulibacter phosphatis]